jgi:plasmid stabilization system protein ParE
MNYQISFHPSVEREYLEAYTWYDSEKQGLGEKFLRRVNAKLELIADNPEAFSQKTGKGYRDAVVGIFPYIIVFKVYKKEKKVLVIAIVHQKKHPSSRRKR